MPTRRCQAAPSGFSRSRWSKLAEVSDIGGRRIIPDGVAVDNRAFDVTPAGLVTAIVTEAGIAHAPYDATLAALVVAGFSGM